MIQYPCPRCGAQRKSLNADCDACDWTVLPPVTPAEVVPPRRMSKGERWAITVMGTIGAAFGWLIGRFILAPVCLAWMVTATVLVLEFVAVFSRPGKKPQFQIRSLLILTTVCALLFLAMRPLSTPIQVLLFGWATLIQDNKVLVSMAIFAALGACFTVPAGLSYNAIGAVRHRPAPVFAYVFLFSSLCFLSAPFVIFLWPMWAINSVVVCLLMMLTSSIAFLIECAVKKSDPAHFRRAIVAILISLHSDLALVAIQLGLGQMAAV